MAVLSLFITVRIFCVIFSSRPISPQLQCTTVVKQRMRPLSPGCEASLERPQNGLKRCLRILAGHVSMLPTDVKLTFPRKNFYQQNNNRKPLTPPPSCPLLWHLRGSRIPTARIPENPQNAFFVTERHQIANKNSSKHLGQYKHVAISRICQFDKLGFLMKF